MKMKRRTYLASLVAVTAGIGYLGLGGSRSSANQNKMVSVTSAHGNVDGLAVEVKITDTEITPASTARLSLTYTNNSDQTITLNINPDRPDPLYSEPVTDTPALILFSDAYEPERVSSDCWKPKKELPVHAAVYEYPLDPDSSVTMEYELWASPKQETACIQTGRYQFEPSKSSFELRVTRSNS